MENITVCICPVTLDIIEEIHSIPFHMFAEESSFAEAIFFDPEMGNGFDFDFGRRENLSAVDFEDLLRTNFFDIRTYNLATLLH